MPLSNTPKGSGPGPHFFHKFIFPAIQRSQGL